MEDRVEKSTVQMLVLNASAAADCYSVLYEDLSQELLEPHSSPEVIVLRYNWINIPSYLVFSNSSFRQEGLKNTSDTDLIFIHHVRWAISTKHGEAGRH